ncbi:MAG: hypothetical protein JWQ64_3020 [Subtercola sp.]|nr:hypothetical protein [Subtercola sp.]
MLQGLAGAPLVPLGIAMLLGKGGMGKKVPVSAALVLFLAPALGPTLGGLLIGAGGWRRQHPRLDRRRRRNAGRRHRLLSPGGLDHDRPRRSLGAIGALFLAGGAGKESALVEPVGE